MVGCEGKAKHGVGAVDFLTTPSRVYRYVPTDGGMMAPAKHLRWISDAALFASRLEKLPGYLVTYLQSSTYSSVTKLRVSAYFVEAHACEGA
jgi:hypothetical protein